MIATKGSGVDVAQRVVDEGYVTSVLLFVPSTFPSTVIAIFCCWQALSH
jgi:hypothetical protein